MFSIFHNWFFLGILLWIGGLLSAGSWVWMVVVPMLLYVVYGILWVVWWLFNPLPPSR